MASSDGTRICANGVGVGYGTMLRRATVKVGVTRGDRDD